MSLAISLDLLDRIRAHSIQAYPGECCGLLLGRADDERCVVQLLLPAANSDRDCSHSRFMIAPREILAAENIARELELDVIGVYHSHPDCPAIPSEYDRKQAFASYFYVILSVAGGTPGELTCWKFPQDGSAFEREGIIIL